MKLSECHADFRSEIFDIAADHSLTPQAVYGLWQQYAEGCRASDQSAILLEFRRQYHGQLIRLNRERRPLFIGVYPAGIVYADRRLEVEGDYSRVAFLCYDTLELKISDRDSDLLPQVIADAGSIQAKAGTLYQISASGQVVLLGAALPGVRDPRELEILRNAAGELQTACCHALDSLVKLTQGLSAAPDHARYIVSVEVFQVACNHIAELRAVIQKSRGQLVQLPPVEKVLQDG